MKKKQINIFGLDKFPEILPEDNIAAIACDVARLNHFSFEDGDIVVVASKIVSKAEGCGFKKDNIEISDFAKKMSAFSGHSEEKMEVVLRESKKIVRMANRRIICETRHGFVMANAGVDFSNAGKEFDILFLPPDPDASAKKIRMELESLTGRKLALIISDTFGRPWRMGQVDMAIGVSGLNPIRDYRGKPDNEGRKMEVTEIAIADEIASAAELIFGKTNKVPVVIIRGYEYEPSETHGAVSLVRDQQFDIFK